jgi:hypothetical protein
MPKNLEVALDDHLRSLVVQQAGAKALVGGNGGIEAPRPEISARLFKTLFPNQAPGPEISARLFERLYPYVAEAPDISARLFETLFAPSPPLPPPPPLLDKLELDSGYITFSGGVPVGGYSHLTVFPNGAYSFTGHFHDSGATSYDMALVWVIRSGSGSAFTFAHSGRVHGTFESGSRDFDWGDSGTNPALAAAWEDISRNGFQWRWDASANFDLGALIDEAVKRVGQVASVIAIVA